MTTAELIAELKRRQDRQPTLFVEDLLPQIIEALEESQNRRLEELVTVGHKYGWNGVENSKFLDRFFDDHIAELEARVERLTAALEAARHCALCGGWNDLKEQP